MCSAIARSLGQFPRIAWSNASTCWTPYYFHADGALSTQKLGDADQPLYQSDTRLLARPPGLLVFETAPLEQELELTGTIEVVLWVSSGLLEADLTFALFDMYPPNLSYPKGYALPLCDDLLHRRYPELPEHAHQSDAAYRMRAETPPVDNVFRRGHRLCMHLTDRRRQPLTMAFPCRAANPAAINRLYLGREFNSHVVLPLIFHRKP